MATIRLDDICITRGPRPTRRGGRRLPALRVGTTRSFAMQHLTLTVPHGTTLVVLGPSGCGKSTLLRVIAGLDAPDAGRVLFNGKDVTLLSPGKRNIGYLFQSYALYPHLTSRGNITSYFFFRRKTPEMTALREHLFRRTSELMDVDIAYLLDRRPAGLSGGEKQRVALGRCITREPELFLLDEPFSNLDAKLRARYRLHLKQLLSEFGITTVYVTHDQQEAVQLGDSIAVMRTVAADGWNEGRVEQVGPVEELYGHPANRFVADFVNLQYDVPPISFIPGAGLAPTLAGYTIGVRPEDVEVVAAGADVGDGGAASGDGATRVQARVEEAVPDPLGQHRVLTLRIADVPVTAKVLPHAPGAVGEAVAVRFRNYHAFDVDSGEAVHPGPELKARLG